MWRISLLLNTGLVWIASFVSAIPMGVLENRFVLYPQEGAKPLPVFSDIALKAPWLLLAIPLIWASALFVLLIRFRQRQPSAELMQLHLSASVLASFTMVLFFALAGILPFVELLKGGVSPS